MFIEIDNEYLIRGIAGAHECQGGGDHFGALRTHASTVVNHQPNGDGHIFVAERFNLLRDLVFIDLKVFLAESGDRSALVIPHGCLQNDQIRIRSDRERANLARLWDALRHDARMEKTISKIERARNSRHFWTARRFMSFSDVALLLRSSCGI